MMAIPYRTGLTTIRLFTQKICTLIVRYDRVIKTILPPDQHVYVDALNKACSDFIEFTDNPRP